MKRVFFKIILAVAAADLAFVPEPVFATQAHGGPEGIMVHQLGHLFFLLSMAAFVYWTRGRRLFRNDGWRHIKYAAMLLILWNLDVIVIHFLDEQMALISTEKSGAWMIGIHAVNGSRFLELFYYVAKLDHLLCVPALFFLFTGLRKLLEIYNSPVAEGDQG